MDYRAGIFYFALLAIVVCVAELYVRANRFGEYEIKVKGIAVPGKPRLFLPALLLFASLILAAVTFPR